jgi:hypothetical protein
MADVFKLSEASKLCGISVATLRLLIGDGLIPAIRTSKGHPQLPAGALPTWQQCRTVVEQQRDRALQSAAEQVRRIGVELEAVGNDIAEARENPHLPLGVDLLAANSYAARGSDTTLSAALHQLDFDRMQVVIYDRALREIIDRDRI